MCAIAHKGLDVETIPWHFTEKEKLASEHGEVPVIVDGDAIVADSWNIACYLEDTYPGSASLFGGSHTIANGKKDWFSNTDNYPYRY